MNKAIACLLTSLVSLSGCALKKMPEAELISVSLSRHTTMANAEFEGHVEKDSAGVVLLNATKEQYGPLCEKQVDADVLQQFRQIILEEKMYRYKESYTPILQVLDGWRWSFRATFADGSYISSRGENARPHDDGLERVRTLMEQLIRAD